MFKSLSLIVTLSILGSVVSYIIPVRRQRLPSTLQSTVSIPSSSPYLVDMTNVKLSSLQGQALRNNVVYPSLADVKKAIGQENFVKDTKVSLGFALLDLLSVSICLLLSHKFLLPLSTSLWASSAVVDKGLAGLVWGLYSVVTGTAAIGMWVTAHECGHGAFSDNRRLQDLVGYLFHSLLLVPYFSWQRSHAIHHANTNHILDGETHVPPLKSDNEATIPTPDRLLKNVATGLFGRYLGTKVYGILQLGLHLLVGWPAYILFGATGGPSRGITNHFIPYNFPRPFKTVGKLKELFPAGQKMKVWLSDIGIVAVGAALYALTKKFGWTTVALAYGGPLAVVNAWLVGYTWLQHTEVDIPHLPAENYSFIKGAFHTVDRPYDKLLWGLVDFLHHHIGSTHVAHHVDSTIPHYKAKIATEKIKENFPDVYLYESTPIFPALWRVATECVEVEKRQTVNKEDLFVFSS